MSDDLITRLRAALDTAEHQARELLAEVQRVSLELQEPKLLGSYQPGWYSWPKVEALVTDRIRLVARDRALLNDHKPLSDEGRAFVGCEVCSYRDVYEDLQVAFPCADVRRAAEFWLDDQP